MANLKPNEIRLNNIDSKLKTSYRYDSIKVKKYLKALLTKCLEALAEEDYTKYNLAESVLNENIVRIGSSLENFEEFYSNLKNEVAIDFLKQLLGTDNISVLAANNPVEAIIITPEKAKLIKETFEFIQYSVAKQEIYNYLDSMDYYKIFENEAYTVIFNVTSTIIIDKKNLTGNYLDSNYRFKFGAELDVLEGFVTNRPELITALTISERILLAENEPDFSNDLDFKYIEESVEEGLAYYNENDYFIVVMNDSLYKIFNKSTGKAFILYYIVGQEDVNKSIRFLADFSDYCLGVKGTLNKDVRQQEEEVIIDSTEKVATEDSSENAVPINEV